MADEGAQVVGGGVVGFVLGVVANFALNWWQKHHDLKREDKRDAQDEWRDIIAQLKASREESERKMRETEDRLVKKLEEKEAAHLKCEMERVRLAERLAYYERGGKTCE